MASEKKVQDFDAKNDNIRKELIKLQNLEHDDGEGKSNLISKLDTIDNKFEDVKAELMREKDENKRMVKNQEETINKLAQDNNVQKEKFE